MAESDNFAVFLERSLHLLALEAPDHFHALRRHMRGLALHVGLTGAEPVHVQVDREPFVGSGTSAQVVVEIAEPDVASILAGRLSIEEALDAGRLELRGELDHMFRMLDALAAWLHGAVRCHAMAELYCDYLAQAETTGPSPVQHGTRMPRPSVI